MKKVITTILVITLLVCMCSCASAPKDKPSQPVQTEAPHEEASYYGTWHISGLPTFVKDPSNTTILITDSDITIETDGERIGPLEYTESYDSTYTYLEIKDDSMPFVLVLINEDMMGLFWSTTEVSAPRYIGETPWEMEFDAEIEIMSVFMKEGAGTTSLPSYLDLEKLASTTELEGYFSDYTEYIYYPNARILQIDGYGFSCFYVYEGGGADYIEMLTLSNLDPSDYNGSDIFTDSNYVITDTK